MPRVRLNGSIQIFSDLLQFYFLHTSQSRTVIGGKIQIWNQKKGTHPSHFHHKIISISDYNLKKWSSHFDHIIITLRWKCEISITYFFKDEIFSSQNYIFLTKIVSELILQIDIKISCHDKTITFLSQFTENVISNCIVMKMLSARYRIRKYEVARIHPIVIKL